MMARPICGEHFLLLSTANTNLTGLFKNVHYYSKVQKGSIFYLYFILKEINTFIQQGCIKLAKIPTFQRILNNKIFSSTTVFNFHNNQKCLLSSKWAYYYDFWRSCDTEDWSNDAENTALITEINYILTDVRNIAVFYSACDQINAALENRRDIFQK